MAKQRADFMRIVQGVAAFVSSLNSGPAPGGLATAVLDLATQRDLEDGGSSAAAYIADNPAWTVEVADVGNELDAIEDRAPIIVVDVLGFSHDEFDQSSDNYVQYWRVETMLGIAARGASRQDAERRFIDICSVLVDGFMGDGSYLNLDRTQSGIEHASLLEMRWTSVRGDQLLCSGFLLLRCRCRFRQSTL